MGRKLFIKNIKILDGSGNSAYKGSLLVDGERITGTFRDDAGMDLTTIEESAHEVIDGHGLCACPGFIDTHSHSDLRAITDPELRPKVMQGITTEVLGQDGISMAPLPESYVETWQQNLAGLDGFSSELDWHYKTTAKYLDLIERARPASNQSYLIPHGNIRMEAMGLGSEKPDRMALDRMKYVLQRGLEGGAFGMSTGLIYMPCAYAETNELIELCKVVADYDSAFVVHQRSEADTIIPSMEEILRIGRESGVKVHFSHFKVAGQKNWQYLDRMLELLDEAKAEGIRVSFDQYPYVSGSTMLAVVLPPWVHDGGISKSLRRLRDKELRRRMIEDMEHGIPGWDNFIDFAGMDNIYITSVKTAKNKDVVGLSLIELGKLRNTNPYDATFDLLCDEENAVGMVDVYGLEDHVKTLLRRPEMNACTDGLLSGKPHPRVYGAFPRILGKYVREEHVITLESAIHKLTKKAAEAMNFKHRGELKENYFADIVLFDEHTIIDKGTLVDPAQYPEGIHYVFVNGEARVKNGHYVEDGIRTGHVLRRA